MNNFQYPDEETYIQNQQQQDQQTPYQQDKLTTSIMEQGGADLIAWMLNPLTDIKIIEHQLRGIALVKEWDESSKTWIDTPKRVSQPVMNEEGISKVLYYLNLHLGKYVGVTNLSEQKIVKLTIQFNTDIVIHFYERWQDYKIEYSDLSPVINSVTRIVYMSLMRANEGHFLRALTQTYREVHSGQSQGGGANPFKKKGMLGKTFGWYG